MCVHVNAHVHVYANVCVTLDNVCDCIHVTLSYFQSSICNAN